MTVCAVEKFIGDAVMAVFGGRAELEEALALYERNGNLVMAERIRSRISALG